jgi:hypothetical protein|tara:strand:+ start:1776 stop:2573 length:798 start_codon:yes stop_codon:yes gene_type:complete
MFLKKYYDLVINTCYEIPTQYKNTTPQYLTASKVSWWNKLDRKQTNMKTCVGFIEFYKNAISLPSPFELTVKYDTKNNKNERTLHWTPDYSFNGPLEYQNYQKNSYAPMVEIHHSDQWGDAFPDMQQFKYVYPWHVEGPKNHNFLVTNNFWQTKKHLQVLNGVLEFYYSHAMNIQFFIENKTQDVVFDYGESPAVLVPLNGKAKYKIHYNYVSAEKWNSLSSGHMFPFYFQKNKYQKFKKADKKFDKKIKEEKKLRKEFRKKFHN